MPTEDLTLTTTVERLKYLLLQELVRRSNEKLPIDPLWLELVNQPTERSLPRLNALMNQQTRGGRTTYEIPLHIATNRDNDETMVLTPLTAALLFQRWDVLDRTFDHLWTRECRTLNRIYKSSRCNLQQTLTLWLTVERMGFTEALWRELKNHGQKPDVRCLVAGHVGRLLTVLHRYRQFKALGQYLMDQAASALSRQPGRAFSDFFERCGQVVRRYFQQPVYDPECRDEDGQIRDVRDTLVGSRYVPPFPKKLDHWIARWTASELQRPMVSVLQRITLERVYRCLVASPGHKEVQRWARAHLPGLLAFMDHKIRPFMTSLLPRRPRVQKSRPLLREGYVFRVHRSQCTYELLNDRHCLVKFQKYQFVLDRPTYEASTGAYWVVVRHGAAVTAATHPWLAQHVTRYHGHVPRLRFGLTRSDGMIWPADTVLRFYPELTTVPEAPLCDLTAHWGLRKVIKNGARPSAHTPVPLDEACVLTRQQLRGMAPAYARWSFEQRSLFYFLFWNLDGSTYLPFDAVSPDFRQTWISMLEDAMDWTQGFDRNELRLWIPMPSRETRPLKNRALFWSRWKFWIPRMALHVQALELFQSNKSPLLTLAEFLPAHHLQSGADVARTLPGEVCRLSHRLQSVWLPLMVPPQLSVEGVGYLVERLLILLLAPDFPPELRRLVWQSLHNLPIYGAGRLQIGHPFFPARSYPVMTASEVQTLPRLFVQLQHAALVPEQTVALTFSRTEALATDLVLLETLALQLQEDVVNPRQVELGFAHEPGRGPSVTAEVLRVLWQLALRDRVVQVLDEDHTVCLAEGAHPDHHRRLYELGFVSALCLHRGYHLPYPLHVGWWRALVTDLDANPVATLCELFPEWSEPRLRMIRNLPADQRRATFADLVEQDPDSLTDEELVQVCFLPQRDALEAFASGWNVCMNHVDLGPMLSHLNGMFCETQQLDLTAANLARVLSLQHDNDYVFLEAVQQLSPDQLQRLVHFITGKPRLPVLEMSENRISVAWGGSRDSTLPRAQNCTNTLLMPHLPVPVTRDRVLECLQTLFEFDTVYGFL